MSTLSDDLEILEQMTTGMRDYLSSGSIYNKKIDRELMYLTLGGYLLRRHRLAALRDRLDAGQQARLSAALEKFELLQRVHGGDIARKAQQELQARLREWEQALTELFDGRPSLAIYRNDVEKRAMIEALVAELEPAGSLLKPELLSRRDRLDQRLRSRWQAGEFLWPAAYQAAYPPETFWWLYGEPV